MLKEVKSTKSEKGQKRRWFSDDYFDLIVWSGNNGDGVTGFQLCYDKDEMERAFSWSADTGTSHNRIDDGEASPFKNMTPILVPDGAVPYEELLRQFHARARELDKDIFELIKIKLKEGLNTGAGS